MRICNFIHPLLIFLFFVVSGNPEELTSEAQGNGSILISVDPFHEGQAFSKQVLLESGSSRDIEIVQISNNVSFVIVQIHVLDNNVTLLLNNSTSKKTVTRSLSGSNIGFEIDVAKNTASIAAATVFNPTNVSLKALIAAVTYNNSAPVPGGCNLEFEFEVSPHQKLRLLESTVIVDGQRASVPRINGASLFPCEKQNVDLVTYRMYLPERDVTEETYFDSLVNMMTVEGIKKHGVPVRSRKGANSEIHHVYSAYPGTGAIYAMIATYEGHSSAYVPAASYACSPLADPSSCSDLNSAMAKVFCAMVLALGICMIFFSTKHPVTETACIGAIFGGIVTFMIVSASGSLGTSNALAVVLGMGVVCSVLFPCSLVCLPTVVTFLSSMTLGFFLASTMSFIMGDTALFDDSLQFWLIFIGATLAVTVVFTVLSFASSALCCAILGSYCLILPIDYWAGSYLKYIVIDTVRRATAVDFRHAIVQPPFQSTEICLIIFLGIISLLGLFLHIGTLRCRGRCCCGWSGYRTIVEGGRAPVLSAPRRGRRILVFGEYDRVSTSH